MTDDIEREALALLNDARPATHGISPSVAHASKWYSVAWPMLLAAVTKLHAERAAHKAFRQDVSERIEACSRAWPGHWSYFSHELDRFILHKPDPLKDVCEELGLGHSATAADELREALAARGLQITEIDNG